MVAPQRHFAGLAGPVDWAGNLLDCRGAHVPVAGLRRAESRALNLTNEEGLRLLAAIWTCSLSAKMVSADQRIILSKAKTSPGYPYRKPWAPAALRSRLSPPTLSLVEPQQGLSARRQGLLATGSDMVAR